MCSFFSFILDPATEQFYYCDAALRKQFRRKGGSYESDSHSVIASHYSLNPDRVCKFEYDPFDDTFRIDHIPQAYKARHDDTELTALGPGSTARLVGMAKKWVKALNFAPLIAGPGLPEKSAAKLLKCLNNKKWRPTFKWGELTPDVVRRLLRADRTFNRVRVWLDKEEKRIPALNAYPSLKIGAGSAYLDQLILAGLLGLKLPVVAREALNLCHTYGVSPTSLLLTTGTQMLRWSRLSGRSTKTRRPHYVYAPIPTQLSRADREWLECLPECPDA